LSGVILKTENKGFWSQEEFRGILRRAGRRACLPQKPQPTMPVFASLVEKPIQTADKA